MFRDFILYQIILSKFYNVPVFILIINITFVPHLCARCNRYDTAMLSINHTKKAFPRQWLITIAILRILCIHETQTLCIHPFFTKFKAIVKQRHDETRKRCPRGSCDTLRNTCHVVAPWHLNFQSFHWYFVHDTVSLYKDWSQMRHCHTKFPFVCLLLFQ